VNGKVPQFFPDQPTAETPAGRMERRMSAVVASYQIDHQATDIRAGHKRAQEEALKRIVKTVREVTLGIERAGK